MKLNIEIRAAEGGDDAKLLVKDQANIYLQYAKKNKLKTEMISVSEAEVG